MHIRVLGNLEVEDEVAGRLADLGGPKPRALLALLVAAEGRVVSGERLVDQMWGEDPPDRVDSSLQSYVARLRRALEPGRSARSPARVLRTHSGGYSLDVADSDVDARRFAALVREAGTTTEPGRAVTLLEDALALWRGEAYGGLSCPSLRAEATRLDELRLATVADLWELRLSEGRHVEAVGALEQLVGLHPLRERLWALLARALYRSARQGDALAALRRARQYLADELGVEPGRELRELEEAILRQDPTLDPPVPVPVRTADVPAVRDPLYGREAALALADEALAAATTGRGRLVLVSGEPGIGKSHFTQALVARAVERGFRAGRGGWEAEECPPLWGWTRALTQLLGDEAALVLAQHQGEDSASVAFRQADAVLSLLRDGPPSLIVLDDVHWADVESLRLLRRTAVDLGDVPVLLVVALRHDTGEVAGPLADTLAGLARTEPLRIELSGLDAAAVAGWVETLGEGSVSEEVATELVRRTDGNPFYVKELVRLLISEGALAEPTSQAWGKVPSGVRDVVRQRVGQLPEDAVRHLRSAAVAGRSFDLAVVAAADEVDAAAVEMVVEEAHARGLVTEESTGRYRFAHALVRDALYESVPPPQRARMHARVAAALEQAYAGRVAEHAAELAEHYRLAGPAHARSGWVLAVKAADLATRSAAHDQAVRLHREALELQDLDPDLEPVEREKALVGLARALTRVARPVEAWQPAEAAARSALAREDGAGAAAALLTVTERMVWGWRVHPHYDDDAIALWREVLALQPDDDVLTRARLTAALAAEHLNRPGSALESTRLADEAVAAVRRSGRRELPELEVLRLAQAGLLRPNLLHHRMPLSDEIVEIATRLDHPPSLAAGLGVRAQERAELGRLTEARSDVVRAHELAERHHLSQSRIVSGWCLALLHQLDEDFAEAERAIEANEEFQATLAMSGSGIGLGQRSLLYDAQGRLPELEPTLRAARGFHPAVRELHALALVRAGRHDELRLVLGPWAEQPELTWDYMWLLLSALRAEVWSELGDQQAIADLDAALEPYADRLATTLAVGFRGSVRLTLGRLAAASGATDRARSHLEGALAVHRDLGLPGWVATTEKALAAL